MRTFFLQIKEALIDDAVWCKMEGGNNTLKVEQCS